MARTNEVHPSAAEAADRLLTEEQAAERLTWSKRTLQRRRQVGLPPAFVKIGFSVRYPERVIENFITAGFRTSTSDTGEAA